MKLNVSRWPAVWRIGIHGFLLVCFGWIPPDAASSAPVPEWAMAESALFATYSYPIGDNEPTPDAVQNPYGTPSSSVTVESPGAGWLDPATSTLVRDDNGGTWDVGWGGTIEIEFPVFGSAEEPVDFDVWVNVVGYDSDGMYELPTLSIHGWDISDFTVSDGFAEADPGPGGGEWRYRSWSGTLPGVTSDRLDFVVTGVTAESGALSLIDSVDVYVIPEPASVGMVLLGGGVVFIAGKAARRRRPKSGAISLSSDDD